MRSEGMDEKKRPGNKVYCEEKRELLKVEKLIFLAPLH